MADLQSLPLAPAATLEEVARILRAHEFDENEFLSIGIKNGLNVAVFRKTPGTFPERKIVALPFGNFPDDPAHVLLFTGEVLVGGKQVNAHFFRLIKIASRSLDDAPAAQPAAPESAGGSAFAPIAADTVVSRALSAVGCDTVYDLGGAPPPLSAAAWPSRGARTDCSGYVAWCLRMSRRVDHPLYRRINGGWFETSAVFADGSDKTGFFVKVAKAAPGDLLVYPDRVRDGAVRQGHIGVVVDAAGAGVAGVSRVAHCASSHFREHGDAVRVTGADAWRAREDSIIVRLGN